MSWPKLVSFSETIAPFAPAMTPLITKYESEL